jgi:p-cumate 2,3-dioxygenase subunit alpha
MGANEPPGFINYPETARQILGDLIIDDPSNGRFKVNRQAFTDQAVLGLEMKKIFARCWLYLAHTSELPAPGHFVSRKVGGRPLMLTRNKAGKLQAFYNSCTHRGAAVCREPAGKQNYFNCPYHGWVFDIDGKLAEMPGRDALPENANDDGSLNLKPVEQLDEYRGFIFVCFDKSTEPLIDYLADAAEYLAYVADQGPAGMEIVGGTQEYSADANWKMLSENSVDGYHGLMTHSTYFEYLRNRDKKEYKRKIGSHGRTLNLGNGHMVGESFGTTAWGRPYARWTEGWGEECREEIEALAKEIYERLGQERGDIVARGDRNMVIFPNLVVNDIMAVTVRTYFPLKPNYMEINSWTLAPVGESKASRDRRLRNFVEFLGPAGFATPDDVEMLESAQAAYASCGPDMWNDCSRGMLTSTPSKTEELQLRTFWRRWNQLLNNGSKKDLQGP